MSIPSPTGRDPRLRFDRSLTFRLLGLSISVIASFFRRLLILRLGWPLSNRALSMIYLKLKTGSSFYLFGLCDLEMGMFGLQVADGVHDICQVNDLLPFGGSHPVSPFPELGPESRTDEISDQITSLSLSLFRQLGIRGLGESDLALLYHESANVAETETDIFARVTTDFHQGFVNRIEDCVNIDEGGRQLPDQVGILEELDVHVILGQVILSQDLYGLSHLISGEAHSSSVLQQPFQCCRPV